MKTLGQFLEEAQTLSEDVESVEEARGVTHTALLKKVANEFQKHAQGDSDFETVNLRRNAHTGASIHHVGSVKAHSLGYKPKPGGNAYTGKEPYNPNKKYAKHPMIDAIKKLGAKHGGKITDSGEGFIDTSDGYRHHFSRTAGTAYSTIEHSFNKRSIKEDVEQFDEGIKEKIKGAIRREKAKDLPLVQTRRDYATNKAGEAYERGETRKGNQYSAWAERDRKKAGDRSTNPTGKYRTKTTDYNEETDSDIRKTKVMHKGEHVATVSTYRGRFGGWTSQAENPDGSSAHKKYGIGLMDTKKEILKKIKTYHKENN